MSSPSYPWSVRKRFCFFLRGVQAKLQWRRIYSRFDSNWVQICDELAASLSCHDAGMRNRFRTSAPLSSPFDQMLLCVQNAFYRAAAGLVSVRVFQNPGNATCFRWFLGLDSSRPISAPVWNLLSDAASWLTQGNVVSITALANGSSHVQVGHGDMLLLLSTFLLRAWMQQLRS